MDLTAESAGEVRVIRVASARIDAAVAIEFKERMRALTDGPWPTVLLDLGEVEFLDSSGLGAVVAVMKHLGPARKLELAGLRPLVAKVFRLTRMDSVFTIHPQVPEALRLRPAV